MRGDQIQKEIKDAPNLDVGDMRVRVSHRTRHCDHQLGYL